MSLSASWHFACLRRGCRRPVTRGHWSSTRTVAKAPAETTHRRNGRKGDRQQQAAHDGIPLRHGKPRGDRHLPGGHVRTLAAGAPSGRVASRWRAHFTGRAVAQAEPPGRTKQTEVVMLAAVHGFARTIGLDRLLGPRSRLRDLALALTLSRLPAPASKLATARGLHPDTLRDSLADVLRLDSVDENDLYAAMDWLRERQRATPGHAASGRRLPGALRPDLQLRGRPLLPAGQARLVSRILSA